MLHCKRSVLDDYNPLARWHTMRIQLPSFPSLPTMVGWPICSGRRARTACCHRASERIIQYTQTRHSSAAMALIPGDTGRR